MLPFRFDQRLMEAYRSFTCPRSPGYWHPKDLVRITEMVNSIHGDFAEVGVWRGDASRVLLRHARKQSKKLHLFDSFYGMAPPGTKDSGSHPEGEFDMGGEVGFRKHMRKAGIEDTEYDTWPGFIPDCFAKLPDNIRFSFVLIDVDNYDPTRLSMEFAWPRLNRGGVMALDDFYPEGSLDSTEAVKEFLTVRQDFYLVDYFNYQLILRRK